MRRPSGWLLALVLVLMPALALAANGVTRITTSESTPVYVTSFSGVDCTGATESGGFLQAGLASLGNTGATVYLPSGCKIGLKSPGPGNVAMTIPSNIHILCSDQSAGFFAQSQYCTGGSFGPSGLYGFFGGAQCNTSADCPGGGTCVTSFGGATANPCDGTSCFAPTSGSNYTMIADQSTSSSGIFIENCSIWTNQADPFQRCVLGTNAGKPCRQECAGGSALPGTRCDVDKDCFGGTCDKSRMDCTPGGGSCSGVPLSPSGLGNITPLDLSRTTNARLVNVSVYDHFRAPASTGNGIAVGALATLLDVNVARELTDCLGPFTPVAGSLCLTKAAGQCCYGAANNPYATDFKNNTQPTTAVPNGVSVTNDAQLTRVFARGSTTAIVAGSRTRIDESTVWPAQTGGPGTPSNGFSIDAYSQVAKSQGLNLLGSGTAVSMSGTAAGVIANKFGFNSGASGGTCITSSSFEGQIVSNICDPMSSASSGINNSGDKANISDNNINMNRSGGFGIKTTGQYVRIVNNQIDAVAGNGVGVFIAQGNELVANNTVAMSGGEQTPTSHQTCIVNNPSGTQNRIVANYCLAGWRGFDTQGVLGQLMNTEIVDNRFLGQSGAPLVTSGAGLFIGGNYMNDGSLGGDTHGALVCDSSCTNGRGAQCNQDSDCTSCNGSVKPCIPEPMVGFVGDPKSTNAASGHNSWFANVVFAGRTTRKQCGGTATNPGALCETAGNTCQGGATCTATGGSGVIATCAAGGSETNRACCLGGAPTCTQRTPVPLIRFVDSGVASYYNEFNFIANTVFTGSGNDSIVGLDFISSANLGNISFTSGQIANNIFDFVSATNSTGIKLPTSGTISGNAISGNNLTGFGGSGSQAIANFQGGFGSIQTPNGQSHIGSAMQEVTTLATDQFFPVDGTQQGTQLTEPPVQQLVGATAQVYRMACMVSAAPGNTNATRTIALRKGGVDTALTCTVGTGATTCNANTVAQVAFAATDLWSYRTRCNVSACAAAHNITCVLYNSYDGGGIL